MGQPAATSVCGALAGSVPKGNEGAAHRTAVVKREQRHSTVCKHKGNQAVRTGSTWRVRLPGKRRHEVSQKQFPRGPGPCSGNLLSTGAPRGLTGVWCPPTVTVPSFTAARGRRECSDQERPTRAHGGGVCRLTQSPNQHRWICGTLHRQVTSDRGTRQTACLGPGEYRNSEIESNK